MKIHQTAVKIQLLSFAAVMLMPCLASFTGCISANICKGAKEYIFEDKKPDIQTKVITNSLGRYSLSAKPEHTISVYSKQVIIIRGTGEVTLRDKSDFSLYIKDHLERQFTVSVIRHTIKMTALRDSSIKSQQ